MTHDAWSRLSAGLGEPDVREHAGDAPVGATLALISARGDDHEIVYTRRRDDLRHHPGQISFPGGRADAGETVPEAALREAAEEIALDPASASVLGALPAFYVWPSRFWLQTVVARWDRPHDLVAAEAEVSEIVRARVSDLLDPRRWRSVRMSVRGTSWAWQLDGDHLLWGATAVMTADLLDRMAPGWNGELSPARLGPDREVRPWLPARERPGRPAVLPDLPEVATEQSPPWPDPPEEARVDAAATACLEVVRRLRSSRIVVLAGGGGNGLAGLSAGERMAAAGHDVQVVIDRPARDLPMSHRARLDRLTPLEIPAELPRGDLFVDALTGGGLVGALRGGARELVMRLRHRDGPVVALDVPTGLDPEHGVQGECIAASVTLALGGPRAGALAPGVDPFVGDLYTVDDLGTLSRLVRAPASGWRE